MLLTSAAIMNDVMRVRFAVHASATVSNIRFICSSKLLGIPTGASGNAMCERSFASIFCTRRSISRTLSR